MITDNVHRLMLSAAVVLGMGTLVACTDSDYDLSEVDMTIGLGNGELLIPTSSTDTILLKDVLKLNDSETVVEQENGDYYFQKDGDAVSPAHPFINQVTVMQSSANSADLNISLAGYLGQTAGRSAVQRLPITLKEEMIVQQFAYQGDLPNEVEELQGADVSNDLTLHVTFSEPIKAYVPEIAELSLELPAYMTLDKIQTSGTYQLTGSKLTLKNVSTAAPLTVSLSVSHLAFNKESGDLGKLSVENGKVMLAAGIRMGVSITNINTSVTGQDPTKCAISTSLNMGRDVTLTKVTGRFDPVIDLGNLGSAAVTGIPDFLTNEGVVIDLANPQIWLDIQSDLDVSGFVKGTLTATKNGSTTASIEIPDMPVLSNAVTHICICRDASAITDPSVHVVPVSELSTLLNPIPDRISFAGSAKADVQQTSDFLLGKQYTVVPSYRIVAPIAFGEQAKIVYTESFDDFNDDIKDFDVTDGTYIEMTADVESRIPAYLNVEAVAIDVNGNEMPQSEVAVKVEGEVKASADGQTVATSAIKVTLQPFKGALKNLDGLKLTISGAAQSEEGNAAITGKTLNAKKHSLVAKNIQIKLVGKAIADLN